MSVGDGRNAAGPACAPRGTTPSLFDEAENEHAWAEPICPGAVVLRRFALADEAVILTTLQAILTRAPLRHMVTPGGFRMSVAMTNCGPYGWVTNRRGYRYDAIDPETGRPWPPMPDIFHGLACQAAARAGFDGFEPDACLINRYIPGARLSLHQDRNERDFAQPIVSVSLGIRGHLSVWRPAPRGKTPAHTADAWRRCGVGRARQASLSRRCAAQGRPSPADGHATHQSDISKSCLISSAATWRSTAAPQAEQSAATRQKSANPVPWIFRRCRYIRINFAHQS